MHKIALKQFMRIVAHGRHLGLHLSQRHCAQFIFSTPPEPPPPVPRRFCHCGEEPCTHQSHVHADMPGLVEQDDGLYAPIARFKRSAEEVAIGDAPPGFRMALRCFIADLEAGARWQDSVLPRVVYRTHTMQLNWHDINGDLHVWNSRWNIC